MTRLVAAVRRHLPGSRGRAVMAGFSHGWHAGYHDAAGTDCTPGIEPCEVLDRVLRASDLLPSK